MRDGRNLRKVSAVQVPTNPSSDYQPDIHPSQLSQFGFISYLSSMVTAPDPVMSYMCRNYALHRIPVFNKAAERFNDRLIEEVKLTKFFLGNKIQTLEDQFTRKSALPWRPG